MGGINTYQYAPNALAWVDPLGLAGCSAQFKSRNEALRAAKRDAGIPMSQQPNRVFNVKNQRLQQYDQVMMIDKYGEPVLNPATKKPIWTREYHYTRSDGSKVIIQDHSAGHYYGQDSIGDQGPHINIRPSDNTRTGSVPGTYDHYSY